LPGSGAYVFACLLIGKLACTLASRPVDLQTSALIVFLVLSAIGIALIAWMLGKVFEANRQQPSV